MIRMRRGGLTPAGGHASRRRGLRAAAALTALTLCELGCSATRPRARESAPIVAKAGDGVRAAQEARVREILATLPAYEEDSLARFEGAEILAVTADIDEMFNPLTRRSFAENFEKLNKDWERLVAFDLILQRQAFG